MSVPTVPLGDLCEILSGFAWSASKFNHDRQGVPIIRIQNVDAVSDNNFVYWNEPYDERFVIRRNDLLLTLSGSFRIESWSGPDALLNQRIVKLTPSPKLETSWLLHVLRPRLGQIERLGKHSLVNNVSLGDIRNLAIPLPSLAEQRRIAEVLDRAEALRAKRRAALAQLDSLTQSLFLDLFGDPVLNPKRWPDPQLGGLLAFMQYGPRFYNESYSEEGIRIVRITDLSEEGVLDFSEMPRLVVSSEDCEKYELLPGDIIFARTGATVGKVALIQPNDPPCIAGAYFIMMRFKESIQPIYARAVLTSPSVRAIVAKRSRQAAQQNFSGPGLRQLPMPVPPIELQREFARQVAAVEKLKTAHRTSLAELDALFASLQHRAFRGEL